MADIAFGSVEKIIRLAAEIKEAVETAKQNREEVVDIQERVETVEDVLSELDKTDVTKNPSMDRALANLHRSLHRALKLIRDCEKKNMLCLFCTARDLSAQLIRVQNDISHKLLQVTRATTVHITKKLGDSNPSRRRHPACPRVASEGAEEIKNDGHSIVDARGSGRSGNDKTTVETGVEDWSPNLSGLKMFSLSELNAATSNFSGDRVIGKGVYSTVYKGVLHDRLVVALKVLCNLHPEDSQRMLLNEVRIGAKLKHKNILKHLGYCMVNRTHILVLDYLPNGSLQDIIRGTKPVEWSSCFRIIQEIAQGIHYLHEQRVIHRDLKPENIFFDKHMNPVIISFGISKILEPDVEEISLNTVVGTIGYMAPETMEFGSHRVSMKSDVYAFGVCLVKTIIVLSTGRRDWYDAAEAWAQEAGGIKGLLDPKFQVDKSPLMQINLYLKVGWLCMEENPAMRPTMADVVQMLSGERELTTPKNHRTK